MVVTELKTKNHFVPVQNGSFAFTRGKYIPKLFLNSLKKKGKFVTIKCKECR